MSGAMNAPMSAQMAVMTSRPLAGDGGAEPVAGERGRLRKAVKRRRIGSIGLKLGLLIAILLAAGFGYFILQLPSREIALDRNADGIVGLTGGDSRVTDALE